MLPWSQKPRIRCDLTGHPSVGGLTPVFAALFPTWAWAVGHAGAGVVSGCDSTVGDCDVPVYRY